MSNITNPLLPQASSIAQIFAHKDMKHGKAIPSVRDPLADSLSGVPLESLAHVFDLQDKPPPSAASLDSKHKEHMLKIKKQASKVLKLKEQASRMEKALKVEEAPNIGHVLADANGEFQAKRFNEGKPEMSYMLDFPVAMAGMAQVMASGSEKYTRNNWKLRQSPQGVMDSLLRHLVAWQSGDHIDDESQLNHLHHVVANALMLAELNT